MKELNNGESVKLANGSFLKQEGTDDKPYVLILEGEHYIGLITGRLKQCDNGRYQVYLKLTPIDTEICVAVF